MNSFYQQQDPYGPRQSSNYHHNVQDYNTSHSGPEMSYYAPERSQASLRSNLQQVHINQNNWEERPHINTTHAAEALSNLGGLSNGRADTTASKFNGYASVNDSNFNIRQPNSRDHTQTGTLQYNYLHTGQPQAEIPSANRRSSNHFQTVMPGRDIIRHRQQGEQDPRHQGAAANNLANASSITHRSNSPTENGQSSNGFGKRLQSDGVSQAYVTQSRKASNDPYAASSSNGYISNRAASATRTLPPVTSVNREVLSTHIPNSGNEGTSHVRPISDYGQRSSTVDPTEVYNPWQEYQRRQAAAQEAAERTRQEEVASKERRNESGEGVSSRADDMEIIRSNTHQPPGSSTHNGFHGSLQPNDVPGGRERSELSSTPVSGQRLSTNTSAKGEVEAEVRAMMSKLRELSSKDPKLLAQIWDQERKAQSSSKTKGSVLESHDVPNTFSMTSREGASKNVTNSSKPNVSENSQPASRTATPQIPKANGATAIAEEVRQRPNFTDAITNRPRTGTQWPPEKKVHVAAAAVEYLRNNPENKDRKITAEEISALLDSNPSYIELCEILEAQGFNIARGVLARSLLSAVPDINSTSPVPNSPATGYDSQNIDAKLNKAQIPTLTSLSVASSPANANFRPFTNGGNSHADPVHVGEVSGTSAKEQLHKVSEPRISAQDKTERSTGQSQRSKTSIQASQNTAKPTSKEEAARKRDFAEIVDLSLMSDEEVGPPVKKIVIENNQQPSHVDRLANQDLGALQAVQDFLHPTQKTNAPNANDTVATKPQPKIAVDNKIKNLPIANDIDETKALRRSTYNVTTIARDVLLATGKHPEMARLNAHLEPLLATFRKLYLTSDLSTLRWDKIDPGNPLPDYYANSDYLSDSTSDEDANRPSAISSVQMATSHGNSTFAQRTNPLIPTNVGKPVFKRKKGRPPSNSYAANESRPYEQSNGLQPNTNSPSTPTTSDRRNAPVTTPGSVATSGSGDSPGVRPSSYTAFRQAMAADGTPLPKKKGRPVGWRKYPSASSTPGSAQGSVSARQPSNLRHAQTADEQQKGAIQKDQDPLSAPKPHFCVYKCLWRGCTAELHNLDTLSKHVSKIHCKPSLDGNYECLWATCGKAIKDVDAATEEETESFSRPSFYSEHDLKAHIEKAHLSVIAWSLGDGPAAGLSGTTS